MSFSAVTVVRPYQQIVGQIQDAIRENELSQGDRLPTERELAETFGVSRSVVREAIKVLAAQGLVEARQGSGLYVLNRPVESVTRAIVLSVAPEGGAVEQLFEFRRLLEIDAARLAAERASSDQIDELWQILDTYDRKSSRPPGWKQFGIADEAVHQLVSQAARNPYLELMIASVRKMMQDVVELLADHPGSIDEAMKHHRWIIEAIAARDPELAAREMGEHVSYTASVVRMQIGLTDPAGAKEESAIT